VKKIDLVEMWISVDTDRVTDKRISFLIGWPWNDVVVTFGSEQETDAWLLALEEYVYSTYALGQHVHRYHYFVWLEADWKISFCYILFIVRCILLPDK
jgi:hypothetical protein